MRRTRPPWPASAAKSWTWSSRWAGGCGKGRHTYPDLTVELVLYACRLVSGEPRPLGAHALRVPDPGGDDGAAVLRGGHPAAGRPGGGKDGAARGDVAANVSAHPGRGPVPREGSVGAGHPDVGRLPGGGHGRGGHQQEDGRRGARVHRQGPRGAGAQGSAHAGAADSVAGALAALPGVRRGRAVLRHRDGWEGEPGAHGGEPVRQRGAARLHPGPEHGRAARGDGVPAAVGVVQRHVLRRAGAAGLLRRGAVPDAGRAHRPALRDEAAGNGRRAEGHRGQPGRGKAATPRRA